MLNLVIVLSNLCLDLGFELLAQLINTVFSRIFTQQSLRPACVYTTRSPRDLIGREPAVYIVYNVHSFSL